MRVGPFEIEVPPEGAWLSDSAARWAAERVWALAGGRADYAGPALVNVRAAGPGSPHALLDGREVECVEPPDSAREGTGSDPLPLLFRTRPGAPMPVADGIVRPAFDPLALAFFMMARWEETVAQERDRHDRFPARASAASRLGFLDRPIVDEWALVLRRRIDQVAPRALDAPSAYEVRLSHDVDAVLRFRSPRDVMLCAVGALARGRGVREAMRQVRSGASSLGNPGGDPYQEGVRRLMGVSERHGLRSAFYFKTAEPGPLDPHYDITSRPTRGLLDEIRERGHEIGFHPGYSTLDDPGRFMDERDRLLSVLGSSPARLGGRQHYLRFRVPTTWRLWDQAGLSYDSTLGYAEHVGFRCGTCHPYPVFDIEEDEELELIEVPLVVMDKTLFKSMSLEPDEAIDVATTMARRCRDVGGTFTLVWHNTAFEGAYHDWSRIYEPLVAAVTGLGDGKGR